MASTANLPESYFSLACRASNSPTQYKATRNHFIAILFNYLWKLTFRIGMCTCHNPHPGYIFSRSKSPRPLPPANSAWSLAALCCQFRSFDWLRATGMNLEVQYLQTHKRRQRQGFKKCRFRCRHFVAGKTAFKPANLAKPRSQTETLWSGFCSTNWFNGSLESERMLQPMNPTVMLGWTRPHNIMK